jgi:8-oxo-dGTP diphosphatase
MIPTWIHVVAGVLSDKAGQVLIARRAAGTHQGGLWEFPGGKLEPGETPSAGLRRELREELGIKVLTSRRLIEVEHDYGDRPVRLDVHRVLSYQGQPQGCEGQPLAWRDPRHLDPADFPAADRPVITALKLPAVYTITPENAPDPRDPRQAAHTARFFTALEDSIQQGAGLVQLRAPALDDQAYHALAQEVAPRCQARGALLILHRDPTLFAEPLPVAGFHLSAARLHGLTQAQRPSAGLLGASCHNAEDLARATALQLDYAFLSPVKPTLSHPGAPPLGWETFAALVRPAGLPVYALGGVGPDDLADAWTHGAQGIAGIRGLWSS